MYFLLWEGFIQPILSPLKQKRVKKKEKKEMENKLIKKYYNNSVDDFKTHIYIFVTG